MGRTESWVKKEPGSLFGVNGEVRSKRMTGPALLEISDLRVNQLGTEARRTRREERQETRGYSGGAQVGGTAASVE